MPFCNLCSTNKKLEKLVPLGTLEIEVKNMVDFHGAEQHGFKKLKSAATIGLVIQSLISRMANRNEYGLISSIDQIGAFLT
jgi:hypothetical protein